MNYDGHDSYESRQDVSILERETTTHHPEQPKETVANEEERRVAEEMLRILTNELLSRKNSSTESKNVFQQIMKHTNQRCGYVLIIS